MVPGDLGTGKGADHAAGYKNVVWHPDLAGDYLFEGPSLDGRLPFMEIKVGYYLSDMTQPNSGALAVVPGSHLRPPQELRDYDYRVPLDQVVTLATRPGAALVWRTAVWHTVTPNLSDIVRKVIYVGYNYRWMRPTDYVQRRSSPAATRSGGNCWARWRRAATRWVAIRTTSRRRNTGYRATGTMCRCAPGPRSGRG
jgi:ectoine hydroxylase-related dioxygenase (phytanoyl-CoA dioxygenase family)